MHYVHRMMYHFYVSLWWLDNLSFYSFLIGCKTNNATKWIKSNNYTLITFGVLQTLHNRWYNQIILQSMMPKKILAFYNPDCFNTCFSTIASGNLQLSLRPSITHVACHTQNWWNFNSLVSQWTWSTLQLLTQSF